MIKIRYKVVAMLTLALGIVGCAQAEPPRLIETCTAVPRPAYFPQLSPNGKSIAYSSVDGFKLMMRMLDTDSVITVDSIGAPGYDARFGGDGLLYYITMERKRNNLVYRTAHSFDVVTGSHHVVLPAQHGAVRLCPTTDGMAIAGEHKNYVVGKGKWVYTENSKLIIVDGKHRTTVSPAGQCAGYIWASLSPDGNKVVFDAVGKGLYVCDLNGKVLAKLGYYLMPQWLDNDYVVAMLSSANNTTVKKQQLVALRADGRGSRVALTEPDEDATYPMVGADGRLVYVGKNVETRLARVTRDPVTAEEKESEPAVRPQRGRSYHVDVD